MKLRTFASSLALATITAFSLGAAFAVSDNGLAKGKNKPIPALGDAPTSPGFAHHAPTDKEKEYRDLARTLRDEDVAFEKQWRSAKAAERQKLRSERFQKLQPTLARMNALARQIAKERAADAAAGAKPVDVTGTPTGPEEIKGKSKEELARMGVAVGAIYQTADSNTDAAAAPSATK